MKGRVLFPWDMLRRTPVSSDDAIVPAKECAVWYVGRPFPCQHTLAFQGIWTSDSSDGGGGFPANVQAFPYEGCVGHGVPGFGDLVIVGPACAH
eukprot:CAMPEP_0177633766 /NCGR_PEP_ID=MMETSP0447-20121125/3015_1 /TAXON_ID=0 /ORGANISM="Stygamoeba regulata, Strain BSH-02190019" /LENGTH=93 /DNA_ID=CAMNT_0019135453 /DNA_START=219 /DNA_END=500 /DNA_ORIENTATION=-